jgi:hypothetical protein
LPRGAPEAQLVLELPPDAQPVTRHALSTEMKRHVDPLRAVAAGAENFASLFMVVNS